MSAVVLVYKPSDWLLHAAIVRVRVRTYDPLGYHTLGEIIMFVGPDDDNACGLTTMPLVYGEVCSMPPYIPGDGKTLSNKQGRC